MCTAKADLVSHGVSQALDGVAGPDDEAVGVEAGVELGQGEGAGAGEEGQAGLAKVPAVHGTGRDVRGGACPRRTNIQKNPDKQAEPTDERKQPRGALHFSTVTSRVASTR